jgi:hypothetical protein
VGRHLAERVVRELDGREATERLRPEWGLAKERVAARSGALEGDSLATAGRVRQPIGSKGDTHNAFDGITYAKGEAVLEMVEAWVGKDVFRRGVQLHLERHAWGNATASGPGAPGLRESVWILFGLRPRRETSRLAFDFLKSHHDELTRRLPKGTFSMTAYLPWVAPGLCTGGASEEIEAFFRPRTAAVDGGARVLDQALESVDQCLARRTAQQPSVAAFFRSRAGGGVPSR